MTEASYLWSSLFEVMQFDVSRDVADGLFALRNPQEFAATLAGLIDMSKRPLFSNNSNANGALVDTNGVDSPYQLNNKHHTMMLNAVSIHNNSGGGGAGASDLYDALDHSFRKYLSYELLFGWPHTPTAAQMQSGSNGGAEGGNASFSMVRRKNSGVSSHHSRTPPPRIKKSSCASGSESSDSSDDDGRIQTKRSAKQKASGNLSSASSASSDDDNADPFQNDGSGYVFRKRGSSKASLPFEPSPNLRPASPASSSHPSSQLFPSSQGVGQVQWMLPHPSIPSKPLPPDAAATLTNSSGSTPTTPPPMSLSFAPSNPSTHGESAMPSGQSPHQQQRGLLRVELHNCPRGVLQDANTIYEDANRVARHYMAWSDKRFEEEEEEYARAVAMAKKNGNSTLAQYMDNNGSETAHKFFRPSYQKKLAEYKAPRRTIRKKFVLIVGGDKYGGDNTMRQWRSGDNRADASRAQREQGGDGDVSVSKHSTRTVLVETHGKARYQVNPVTEWVKKSTFADKARGGEPSQTEEDVWVLQCTDMNAETTVNTFSGLIRSYVGQVGKAVGGGGAGASSVNSSPRHGPASSPVGSEANTGQLGRRVGARPLDNYFEYNTATSPSSPPNAAAASPPPSAPSAADTRIVIQVIIAADFSHQTVKTPTALAALHGTFLPTMDALYREMVARDRELFPGSVCQVIFRVEVVICNAPVAISNPTPSSLAAAITDHFDECAKLCRELFLSVHYPSITVALDMPATAFFCGIEVPMWGTSSRDVEAVNILFARVHRGLGDGSQDAARIVIHRGMDVGKDDHLASTVSDRHTEGVALNNIMFHFWAVSPTAYRMASQGYMRLLQRGGAGGGGGPADGQKKIVSNNGSMAAIPNNDSFGPSLASEADVTSVLVNGKAIATNALQQQQSFRDPHRDSPILKGYRIYRTIMNSVCPMLRQFTAALRYQLAPSPSSRHPLTPSNAPLRSLTEAVTVRRCDPALTELVVKIGVSGRRMAAASSAELVWGIVRAAFNTIGIHIMLQTQSSSETLPSSNPSQPNTTTTTPSVGAQQHPLSALPPPSSSAQQQQQQHKDPSNAVSSTIAMTEYTLELNLQPFQHARHAVLINAIPYLGPLLANGLFPLWDIAINLRVRLFQALREGNRAVATVMAKGSEKLSQPMTAAPDKSNAAAAAAQPPLIGPGDGVLFPIPIIGDLDDFCETDAVSLPQWLAPSRVDPYTDGHHPTRLYNRSMQRRAQCSVYIPISRVLVVPREMVEDQARRFAALPGEGRPLDGEALLALCEFNVQHRNALEEVAVEFAATVMELASAAAIHNRNVQRQLRMCGKRCLLQQNAAVVGVGKGEAGSKASLPTMPSSAQLLPPAAGNLSSTPFGMTPPVPPPSSTAGGQQQSQQLLNANKSLPLAANTSFAASPPTPSKNSVVGGDAAFIQRFVELNPLPLAEMLVAKIIDTRKEGVFNNNAGGATNADADANAHSAPAVEIGLFVDFNDLSHAFNCSFPKPSFNPYYKGYSLSGTSAEWARWLRSVTELFATKEGGSYQRAETLVTGTVRKHSSYHSLSSAHSPSSLPIARQGGGQSSLLLNPSTTSAASPLTAGQTAIVVGGGNSPPQGMFATLGVATKDDDVAT